MPGLTLLLSLLVALPSSLAALGIALANRRRLDGLGREVEAAVRLLGTAPSRETPSGAGRAIRSVIARREKPGPVACEPGVDELASAVEAEPKPEAAPDPLADTPLPAAAAITHDAPPTPEPKRPSPAVSMEERLGARVFVWVGGIALALAGAFLFKYGYDHVTLTDAQRVWAGAALGGGLLVGGLWARSRAANVSQAMVGAAMAVWYGCLVAATRVFDLIDPGVGFVLTGVVTATAVGLSLRHGPFVAVLGLLGGFVMPALLGGEAESLGPIVSYLVVLEAGLIVVARRRGWATLSGVAMAGAFVWAAIGAATGEGAADRLWVAGLAIATAAVYLLQAARPRGAEPEKAGGVVAQAVLAAAIATLFLGGLAVQSGYATTELALVGIAGAGLLVLARLREAYVPLAFLAAGMSAAITLASAWSWAVAGLVVDLDKLAWACVGYGGLFTVGGYAASHGAGRRAPFAALSGASAFGSFAIAATHLPVDDYRWPLVVAAVALPAAMVAAARPWKGGRPGGSIETDTALALPAAGIATLGVGVLVPWELKPLAWAALGVAASFGVRRDGGWRPAVAWLTALGAGALVTVAPPLSELDAWPAMTMLPLQLAGGLLAIGVVARRAWVIGDEAAARWATATAVGFAAVAGGWLVRHAFHGQAWLAEPTLREIATAAAVWMLGGVVLLRAALGRGWSMLERGGFAVAAMGLVVAGVGGVVTLNPLWSGASVGSWPVFNGLLFFYGLPMVVAAGLAWLQRRRRAAVVQAAGAYALAMLFVLVSLQVRHAFAGPVLELSARRVTQAESYAYSAAWVVLGIALLVAGWAWRAAWLRFGSLAVMLVAIGKVFLVDGSTLDGLLRVGSFLGLGLSLMLLGYVYQRFVFRRGGKAGDASAAPS